MSVALPHPLPPRAAVTDEPLFRLTVDQYHELIRSGKLSDDDPVELLEGLLVFQMPKNTPHATATRLCRRAVEPLLLPGCFYDSQEPVTLTDGEPEPDGMVIIGRVEDYARSHPGPSDVALVIEIADTSLDRDQGIKLRSYARAAIAVYWVLDLSSRILHVYTNPDPRATPQPTYRGHEQLHPNEEAALVVAGQTLGQIAVSSLFPPGE